MLMKDPCNINQFMEGFRRRNEGQEEFYQAVHEVVVSVLPIINEHQKYRDAGILERLTEPDRIITYRVTWMDDAGYVRANRAWRVQFNNSIGPYKGGLRFDRNLNVSILKFLGFEQTFKNALTGLPMGGAKGGANFNPKGKSPAEVMRFCHAMMTELQRHIGEDIDIPAGDIGVGARELGFLFGQYKRLHNRFAGVLTGKGLAFGGSHGRKEATGHGAVYFVREMLHHIGESIEDKRVVVSGSGNVALYTVEKLNHLGAIPVTVSDSQGTVYDPEGIDLEKLEWLKDLKEVRRGRVREYAEHFGCEYLEGKRPWAVPCDLAMPCATQNELDDEDAKDLVANKAILVAEGANMPTTEEAVHRLQQAGVMFGPAKAVNAGGVAVSGLEQSQNSLRISWSVEEVDEKLRTIMREIHEKCVEHGGEVNGKVDYQKGANIAGFLKVADAMLAYGAV